MPLKTGFVYHDRFLEHDPGPGHPERPERLRAIVDHFKEVKLWQELQHLVIDEASDEWILKIHTPEYVRLVREACRSGRKILDQGDTHVSLESYDVARLAVGGVLAAVDAVMSGLLRNAFCAVRPPGHHAEKDAAMGFCLFNNIAIGARYAQAKCGIERIAIIDWDVHHGNGTQHSFYDDRSVFYVSLHQYPYYPGTGSRFERGEGSGLDYNLNIPLSAGSGEEEYLDTFRREILPTLDGFRPELVMISAGFDAHENDPLASMKLTEKSYALMTQMLMNTASRYCEGRIVSVLEGGYDRRALARSAEAHVRQLLVGQIL